MVDMRLTSEEKKDFCTPQMDVPSYPHGLVIRLSHEEYEKLSFQSIPEVGSKLKLFALVSVKEVSLDHEGKPSLCLQIMDMELKSDKQVEQPKDASKVLYGE